MSLPNRHDTDTLELMIDRIGLTETLNCIAAICADKAEHLRTNWQARAMAMEWDKAGTRISGAADRIDSEICG